MDQKKIRIVNFEGVSADLCGGTHVENTSNIEKYKIVSLETKGVGIWRIRAITSNKIINKYFDKLFDKYLNEFLTIIKKAKKYEILVDKKLENINPKAFKNSEQAYNFLLKKSQIIKNEIKEKMKNEKKDFSINEKNISKVSTNNFNCVFYNAELNENLKLIAVNLRESNPNSVVFAFSNKKDGKNPIVIATKLEIENEIADLKNSLNLRGGGRSILWQGVSNNFIDTKKIIEILEAKNG